MVTVYLVVILILYTNFVYADDGWFWHVTDFHYDPTYLDVALSCNRNASARGEFGSSWCDSPWKLVTSSIEAMRDKEPNVDFILWTGDSSPHIKDNVGSHDMYRDIVRNITRELKSKFNSTPIYPVFGNHDYYPAHQFPPNNNLMYDEIYEGWKDWINDDGQKKNFQKGAYYTVQISTGLRIMSLNTNLYYRSDKISRMYRYSDPADQFQWMAETLEHAKNNSERVIIMSHVPPGVIATEKATWMYPQFNHRFNEIILEYSDTIAGLYFGHEHMDNFRISYKSGLPVIVHLCAPSVTPWTYIPGGQGIGEPTRNPGIRLVRYDRMTGQPQEVRQYHLDFKLSNVNKVANWTLEYSMPKDYQMKDLTPTSFHGLLERMKSNGSAEFTDYAMRRYVGGASNDRRVTHCSSLACKKPFICSIGNVDLAEFEFCDSDGTSRNPAFG
ncbi:acid sphingomyelinase-like phosphodiesterase 3b [Mytilus trossulus]|uniref:acid sphingomyelinase-like phosphodiesterase 3b n=1 Tax=Mytilus trossulus TaxID=6551 RepID=UPI0030059D49